MRTQANGETIRRLREEQGLTLKALAKLADISEAHMCRLENGARHGTVEMRGKIARALGATITDISKPVPCPVTPEQAAA